MKQYFVAFKQEESYRYNELAADNVAYNCSCSQALQVLFSSANGLLFITPALQKGLFPGRY
jgi:hypothetical protein